ncbi:Uncharacterized protein Adt_27694 [Abeliophyllum distichum]|uniref:Retrotransposon gag domain-containing protein n=1 Tax=Abeliophyllum distichum TaxID=126358 RepID=A0ABD1RUG3_9LAMI
MRSRDNIDLVPLDPEIERTLRNRFIAQKLESKMAHNGHEQPIVEIHRPLMDYIIPVVGENFTCWVPPAIPANNYAIKPGTIQLVQQTVQFHGLPDEDPHEHGETIFEAWERFNDMLRHCPNHGIPDWLMVQTFYNGLNDENKRHADSAGGGSLMDKTYDEASGILEKMAANSYQ